VESPREIWLAYNFNEKRFQLFQFLLYSKPNIDKDCLHVCMSWIYGHRIPPTLGHVFFEKLFAKFEHALRTRGVDYPALFPAPVTKGSLLIR